MERVKKMLKKVHQRTWKSVCIAMAMIMLHPVVAFAAENQYAKAGAEWILDGVFWVVLVVGIFGAGMNAVKRNATAAVGILFGAALICVIAKNPTIITGIGTTLKDAFGLG
ncbi:hypothetical protein [Clostridium minihomine]|uniref:hypothetical protein n=1 Tax=Clostridium minihomine TaxID=2045012 RepID=UPI000C787CD5|nr:hypothetical protein [Clostridium minihomine]